MPELPEVETVVRGLRKRVESSRILKVKVFRETPLSVKADVFANALAGQQIRVIRRRAKYLLFELDRHILLGHLRMTGKFVVTHPDVAQGPYHRVWFYLEPEALLVYEDVRCLGTLELLTPEEAEKKLEKLGPEPLAETFTSLELFQQCQKSARPIKVFLLDQRNIAGIGNIYASEILFASGLNPERPAHRISKKECQKMYEAMRRILQDSIDHHGTSVSDFRRVDDKTGEFQNFLNVYDKTNQPCRICHTPVQRMVQQQRSTFFCPTCQP
ncbi:MAG: bifunctional DNA-formamidopyrimidine glycosylase/DNA-(apurinic or apyrimidinic site) lyase [SAR324 cluster bacterium]|nr:bifunctional DNA-formamidopyrimidine glycosylase/DNA-(apurinic or apyrimidinic site) lyase [SAR324 cluster bacterium]